MFARLYPKIKTSMTRLGRRSYIYFRKHQHGRSSWHYVKDGESLIVEGGAATGKTIFLTKLRKKLEVSGEQVIYINALEPVGYWVKEWKLFGKNLERRIDLFLGALPDRYYLIVDNAEKLSDTRKTEIFLELMGKARGTIIGCNQFAWLNPKVKVRLKDAKTHHLGRGADTFDVTMFLLVIMIAFIAVAGYSSLFFLAAAVRLLFQGVRMGGRKI